MSSGKYKKLLEPGCIGSVKVKRRIIRTGANPGFYPYEDGNVPQKMIDFYEGLAQGGAGLVTAGAGEIDWPIGTVPNWGYRMDEEKYIPSLKKLSDAIHRHNCPAFIQIFHMGPMHPEIVSGHQPISSSSIPKNEIPRPNFFVSREMTLEDIKRVQGKFVAAAVIAQKAGFDGIELNGGCNHLLNSFLSRAWNRRHDAYGCDNVENRARIVVEIIQGIKQATGKDFAIMTLINGLESGLKDGITLEDSKAFAKMIEKAGSDAIQVRVEFYTNPADILRRDSTHFPDMLHFPEDPKGLEKEIDMSHHGQGGWVPVAAEIKKLVKIPVIVAGRLDPDLGEKIIREGKVDFVNHNRRLMADYDLPNKIAEGREEDIAPCTACMTCFDAGEHGREPICRINPALGKGKEYDIKPAAQKKKVMIIGGGPSGMEAARVAALRGHDVTLYDKIGKLGGAMLVAATVKGVEKEDLVGLIRYFEIQLKKLGVKVNLGKEVTPALVDKVKPDVLILAAGGKHNIPDIPGIDNGKVLTSEKLHNQLKTALKFAGPELLHTLTDKYMPVGKSVIVIGGRLHGCQTAEFLVKRGRKVTIVDTCPQEQIGEGLLETFIKPWLLLWLDEKGVKIIPEVKYEEINKEGLVITTKDGKRQTLKADSIVTAMPMKPNTAIQEKMRNKAKEVFTIGDSREPKYIVDAIADGARIGRQF